MLFNTVSSITTQQLQEKLKNDIQLIDVREKYEYDAGHIQQATNFPLSMIGQFNGKKENTYYIICQSGMRSKRAAKALKKMGYDVINVAGGMNQWSGKIC